MRQIQTEILVIGGGATGTGLVRDLAMRGFKTILVERRDLSHGTSGRYHGLLHSGGRYVVSDPLSATECAQENAILTRIQASAIEPVGVSPHMVEAPANMRMPVITIFLRPKTSAILPPNAKSAARVSR